MPTSAWRVEPSRHRTDAELLAPWTLRRGGTEIFTVPRLIALRTLLLQHATHHRGQLSVYLRLLDVPLPPLYGPTADEPLLSGGPWVHWSWVGSMSSGD